MKHTLSTISLAITLSYAALPAFATPTAEIVQHKSSQTATIDQDNVAGNTYAKIKQGGGTDNEGHILQSSTRGATSADVLQHGNYNFANVDQASGKDSTVTIKQQSDYNQANAYQTGSNHVATINQDSYGSAAGNYAITNQTGSHNETTVNQTGANTADVTQGGHYQTALVTQFGENDAKIEQYSYGHSAEIYQSGGHVAMNIASVTQTAGVASIGNITQTGNGHNATITQH